MPHNGRHFGQMVWNPPMCGEFIRVALRRRRALNAQEELRRVSFHYKRNECRGAVAAAALVV
jgi:hypothetical protein